MARPSRMVLNRQALHEVDLAFAVGFEALAEAALDATDPPDQEPLGMGLVQRGDWVTYVDGKKVGGTAAKPRRLLVRGKGVTGAVGWGFPARFNELGTSRQEPRPFFTPAAMSVMPQAAAIVAPVMKPRLPRPAGR